SGARARGRPSAPTTHERVIRMRSGSDRAGVAKSAPVAMSMSATGIALLLFIWLALDPARSLGPEGPLPDGNGRLQAFHDLTATVKCLGPVRRGHGHHHAGLAEAEPSQAVYDTDPASGPGRERLLGHGAQALFRHALVGLVLERFHLPFALVIAHRSHEHADGAGGGRFHGAAHALDIDGLARERHFGRPPAAAGHGRDPRHLVTVSEPG